MTQPSSGQVFQYIVGTKRPRRAIAGGVGVLLLLASIAFLLGFNVGLNAFGGGWILLALGIAGIAGIVGAGLGLTVGLLWLITHWWFVFPPLVGYLTGDWTGASRYVHPRMSAFAYGSARAELFGGLRYGVRLGLFFAVVPGSLAYAIGTTINWVRRRFLSHDT